MANRTPPLPPPAPPPQGPLRDPVRHPPSSDSLRMGTTVALIAHVGLIAALAYGVAWKREEIATVSAELWSAVPQQAAPAAPPPAPAPQVKPAPVRQPPVRQPPAPEPPAPIVKPPPPRPPPAPAPKVVEPPPPPAPREADIAREKADKRRREAEAAQKQEQLARLEQAKRDKAEKAEKAARDKEKQKEADKQAALKLEADRKAAEKAAEKAAAKAAEKAVAAEQDRAAKAREDNLRRLQKQLGEGRDDAAPPSPSRTTPSAGTGGGNAAQSSGPSAGYAGRLRAYFKPKLVYTGRNIGSTPAVVRLRVAPDGTILARELIKSSGQADWDQAVLDAIDRAGVVPRDTDSRVPPVIDIPWTASER
jgi:colicin import membrane protein